MKMTEFNKFFETHSQNVDSADSRGFWKLTDEVLENLLKGYMNKTERVHVVDFGGGTGRWLSKFEEHFADSSFTIVDLSTHMLAQAQKKIDDTNVFRRNDLKLIQSDISDVRELEDGSADYIISTYNPLSFCNDPQKVIDEAYRILKPGGIAMITIQGYYNALSSKINNYLSDGDEIWEIYKTKRVQWNTSVPALWQLPKADMESMFASAGFGEITAHGIAVLVQPSAEDFDPTNSALGPLSKKLQEDQNFYQALFRIESDLAQNEQVADRGMNILQVGVKPLPSP